MRWFAIVALIVFGLAAPAYADGIFDDPSDAFWQAYNNAAGASQPNDILIFGGQNNTVFLGCLNCGEYDGDSVRNEYGPHGSRYASASIFNQYGQFGGPNSRYSPCNQYSLNGPVLVGPKGQYYGRLTLNRYASDVISDDTIVAWLAGVCHCRELSHHLMPMER